MPPMPSSFIHHVEDDATAESIREQLSESPLSLVLAVASFAPRCKALLRDVSTLEKDYEGESRRGPAPTRPDVFVIRTDASDELEGLAIELGLSDVPSYRIYRRGTVVGASSSVADVRPDAIRDRLKSLAVGPGAACRASVICCPDGSDTAEAPSDPSEVLRLVQQSYANTVNRAGDGEGGCCASVDPGAMGYTREQILRAGKDANLGLGCGNPISFAGARPGETVADLGSGAGADCFLAADLVGPAGSVVGVDMTPEMVRRARRNAASRGADNVEFRLGEIEHLPIADGAVDLVISNCVVNLSPDKARVFREAHRVLRPGGRIAISDVVMRPGKVLPRDLRTAEALAC